MLVKEGDKLKITKPVEYYKEHCPICDGPVVGHCKCFIGSKHCSNKHAWYIKDNNVIYGTGHGGSKSEPIEIKEQKNNLFSAKKFNNKKMKITKDYLKELINEVLVEQLEKRKYVKVSPEIKSKMDLYKQTKQKDYTPIVNSLKETPEYKAIIAKGYGLKSSDRQEKTGILIFRNEKTKQSYKVDSLGRVAKFTKDVEGSYIIKPTALKPLETVDDYKKILKTLETKM